MVRKIVLCLVASGLGVCYAEAPGLYWHSSPNKPGETVMAMGGNFKEGMTIQSSGKIFSPVKFTTSAVWFPFPATKDALVSYTLSSSEGTSTRQYLNKPDLWWVQSEHGAEGQPGEELRLFGRTLAYHNQATIRLTNSEGKEFLFPLSGEAADVWGLRVRLPETMPLGDYQVSVDNHYPRENDVPRFFESLPFKVARRAQIWKDEVFDVTSFGAVPNDAEDDTLAVKAALEAVTKNGGGTLLFPRGRYMLSAALMIPEHTRLAGEGKNLSCLEFRDTETPPEAWLVAGSYFAMEDLFIFGPNKNRSVLQIRPPQKKSVQILGGSRTIYNEEIYLRRIKMKFAPRQHDEGKWDATFRRFFNTIQGNLIRIGQCAHVTIEDCQFYTEAFHAMTFIVNGKNMIMRRNRFSGPAWNSFGGDHFIFEENFMNNQCASVCPAARNFVYRKNTQIDSFRNGDNEGLTTDGGHTAFQKRVPPQRCVPGYSVAGQVDGCNVTLTFDRCDQKGNCTGPASSWKGYEIQIQEGKGVGQTRTIREISDYTHLTIDRPFDVTPDATSRFVICAERRNMLFIDNDLGDSGTAIQLFGGITDCVVARNKSERSGGYHGEGRNYHHLIPCWGVQFLENEIIEGNSYRTLNPGGNGSVPNDSVIGACPMNGQLHPLTRGYVIRNNHLHNNSYITMHGYDALIEGNRIENCDLGVECGDPACARTLYCHNNTFTHVEKRYDETFLKHASKGGDAWVQAEYARLAEEAQKTISIQSGKSTHVTPLFMSHYLGLRVERGGTGWKSEFQKLFAENKPQKGTLPIRLQLDGPLPGAKLSARLALPPGLVTAPWSFAPSVESTALSQKGPLTLNYPYEVAGGVPRGPFSLPLEFSLLLKSGKTLVWKDHVPLSHANFTQFMIARGSSSNEWKRATYLNPDHSINIPKEFENVKPNEVFYAKTRFVVSQEAIHARVGGSTRFLHTVTPKGIFPSTVYMMRSDILSPGTYEVLFKVRADEKGQVPRLAGDFTLSWAHALHPGTVQFVTPQ